MKDSEELTDDRLTLSDIIGALEVQGRVIKGLILRETKSRYGRHKLGFFWIFIEPIFMVALFLAFKLIIASPTSGGMPDVYFIITGVVPFALFRQTMSMLDMSIIKARALLAFPQVTTLDVIISTIILEFSILLFVFGAMVIGAAVFFEPIRIENPLFVLYSTLLLGVTGAGFGLVFASVIPLLPSVKNFSALILGRPLFFTSGVFFTLDMLPEVARDILIYSPFIHMIEMVRSGFFIQFESAYMDVHFATLFALGSLLFGLLMHQALKDHVIKVA